MGQVVEKSSLNYYTVNKVPKMYPDKVKEIENKYHNPVSSFKSKINLESKAESDFNSYIQNLDVECFVEKVFNA
jgi:ATP-dependent phosphoenolpyruvate carboxykinase